VVKAIDNLCVVAADSLAAVFPNPVGMGEALNIEWKEMAKASLYIFDINGKMVFTDQINSEYYTLPDLGLKGIYMVNIRSKQTNLCWKVVFQ